MSSADVKVEFFHGIPEGGVHQIIGAFGAGPNAFQISKHGGIEALPEYLARLLVGFAVPLPPTGVNFSK
jgi:hypothetical protein